MEAQKETKDLSLVLPKRALGSYSHQFKKISIVSNHFEVKILKQIEKLNIFSIKFQPRIPADNRQKRREILNNNESQIKIFLGEQPTYGGMNIFTTTQPQAQEKQFFNDGYKVILKKVATVDVKANPNSLLFFLNNRFRNVMNQTGYNEIGRTGKYFNIKRKKEIDNLNMYSGFKANFCFLEKGIFFRVDSAKKIVRNQSVLDMINDIYQKNEGKDRDDKRNIVRNALKDQIIQVNYGNGKYYKIQDIVYKQLTESFIEGQKLSLIDYYKNKYNIAITKTKQPLLKAQNKKGKIEILLVPELCLMTGIPDDFDEMKRKKISEQTIMEASRKRGEILQVMDQIKKTDDFESLTGIGIQLSKKMQEIQGKSIPVPRLALGQNQNIQQGKQAMFQLFGQPIFANKHKVKLAILYFRADIRDMVKTFQATSRNLKVDFSYEKFEIRDERRAVQEISRVLKKACSQDCNISLIVIPNNMRSQYKRIKQASLIDNKMVCQVATQGKLRNKNAQSIATKILLQIIAKRGNTLWVPKTRSKAEDTMLLGFDTGSLGGNRNCLGACGTVNSTFTSVCSKNVQYLGIQNKFTAMYTASLDIVNYYVDRNKTPPKEMIIFMNSCSMEQVKALKQYFIEQFMKKAEQIYKEKAPAVQVVMVNTKTSERFFTPNGENVRAGTLINSDVVSKDYDFYLVSQGSNRGCIVPNHYKIVYSNSKMEEGVLEELVFGQCFNYVNWSGSIKVPGILQYAKKCAKFNSEVMQDSKVSESLQRCLYFV